MSFNKRLRENMEYFTFCHSREDGEGFVLKDECKCYREGNFCCQAYNDKEKFHSYFEGLSMGEIAKQRKKIIESIEDEFKDSQWFKDNVVK